MIITSDPIQLKDRVTQARAPCTPTGRIWSSRHSFLWLSLPVLCGALSFFVSLPLSHCRTKQKKQSLAFLNSYPVLSSSPLLHPSLSFFRFLFYIQHSTALCFTFLFFLLLSLLDRSQVKRKKVQYIQYNTVQYSTKIYYTKQSRTRYTVLVYLSLAALFRTMTEIRVHRAIAITPSCLSSVIDLVYTLK